MQSIKTFTSQDKNFKCEKKIKKMLKIQIKM